MAIPPNIKLISDPPPRPGVYLMKDARGRILYIGKATSLKTRVSSYFFSPDLSRAGSREPGRGARPLEARLAAMIAKVRRIDIEETPTAIEALLLESRLIKKHQPHYNVMEKDDKSFVHLAFTAEEYPRPVLIRGHELDRAPKSRFLKTFGPFRSTASVHAALDALRRSFPWTDCQLGRKRPCFYRHLGLCPGVCTGEISPVEYRAVIRGLMRFFSGGRTAVVREMKKKMTEASKAHHFEEAAELRDRLYHLDHIRDVAVLKREDRAALRLGSGQADAIDVYGRIEGYDISNIGGQDAVGSMVVFEDGEPRKRDYRLFRIRSVEGPNDVGSIAEVLRRRFLHGAESRWKLPQLVLIDGGAGQVRAAERELASAKLRIPVVGIAKGPDRKRDELVFRRGDHELARVAAAFKPLLVRVRDEAHRFAIGYHRRLRGKNFLKECPASFFHY